MSLRITPPEPVDVVSADEVRAIIGATDRELAELDREVQSALATAESAESLAREAGVDGRASTWAMLRMQRFLDGLRGETEAEIIALLDVARTRARKRVDEARAEADAMLAQGTPTSEAIAAPVPPVPPVDTPPVVAPPQPEPSPVEQWPPVVAMPVVPAPEPEPTSAETPSVAAESAAAPEAPEADAPVRYADYDAGQFASAPEPNGHVVAAPVDEHIEPYESAAYHDVHGVDDHGAEAAVAPVVYDAPEQWDALIPGTPSAAAAVAVDHTAPTVLPADQTIAAPVYGDVPPEFWPEEKPVERKRRFRVPISAVLEVIAVLLILVFILLRLS